MDTQFSFNDDLNAREQLYIVADSEDIGRYITLEDAIKVSAARCAAVSFRNTDYGLEKCKEVYGRLVGDERKHASALEHQATPIRPIVKGYALSDIINSPFFSETWEPGISHADRDGNLWSGNFKGFVQHRKLVPGENHE